MAALAAVVIACVDVSFTAVGQVVVTISEAREADGAALATRACRGTGAGPGHARAATFAAVAVAVVEVGLAAVGRVAVAVSEAREAHHTAFVAGALHAGVGRRLDGGAITPARSAVLAVPHQVRLAAVAPIAVAVSPRSQAVRRAGAHVAEVGAVRKVGACSATRSAVVRVGIDIDFTTVQRIVVAVCPPGLALGAADAIGARPGGTVLYPTHVATSTAVVYIVVGGHFTAVARVVVAVLASGDAAAEAALAADACRLGAGRRWASLAAGAAVFRVGIGVHLA